MSEEDILYDAAEHVANAEVFEDAKAKALSLEHPDILILVSDGSDLYAFANGVTVHTTAFLAQSYVTKLVLDSYPEPLEDAEDE